MSEVWSIFGQVLWSILKLKDDLYVFLNLTPFSLSYLLAQYVSANKMSILLKSP